MSATPFRRMEYCFGGEEFRAPPGYCFTVRLPLESSANFLAKGVNTARFIGCLGPIKYDRLSSFDVEEFVAEAAARTTTIAVKQFNVFRILIPPYFYQ